MRNAAGTLRVMFAIAVMLTVQAAVALWRAAPEVIDTGRAIFHALAGVCRHTLTPNETEGITLVAFGLIAGVTLVLARFARCAVSRWRRTRARVRLLLAARTAAWPAEMSGAAARLGMCDRIDVVSHPAPFAFCYGFLRPRICVSSGLAGLLTAAELEAVLLHEDHHRRQRDPLLLLLVGALAHALAFLPTLRDLQARYDAVKEFEADDAAIRQLGGPEPMAGALYKVLCNPLAGPDLAAVAVGGLSVTERRIDHLLAPRQDDVPGLSRRRLAVSGVTMGAISLPLLALTLANIQPMVHACRF